MAPPFMDPEMTGTLQKDVPSLSQPAHYIEPQQIGRRRHDSVLYSQRTPARFSDLLVESIDTESLATNSCISGMSRDSACSTYPGASQTQSNFHFVVTTNPNRPRDRFKMRENRAHVMHDYLRKERRKTPGTRDIRAEGPRQVEQRRHLTSCSKKAKTSRQLPAPRNTSYPSMLTPQSLYSSSLAPGSEHEGTVFSRPASQSARDVESSIATFSCSNPGEGEASPGCTISGDGFVHCPGLCGCPWSEQDLATASGVPDLFDAWGLRVMPYQTWLRSTGSSVNIGKLKRTCGMRLRSCAMANTWLPQVNRARHSFLSTICITTAHDDAMRRSVFGSTSLSEARSSNALDEKLAIRTEVICMINESLDHPEQRTSDANIIAVLHILNSETIGCDRHAMRLHQQGLDKMVTMRGGLEKLGVLGQLARMLTVAMLLSAVLHEEVADERYLLYAGAPATPPQDGAVFPESPIYCGRQCSTVSSILGPKSDALALLKLLRKMTLVYQAHDEPDSTALRYFHEKIMRYEGSQTANDSLQMIRVYEAIRLTARLYADALVESLHFSQVTFRRTSQSDTNSKTREKKPARHVEIVRHLKHTDLDRVWGGLSGVLFWIVLVAGAASRRMTANETIDHIDEQEEEEARQWLAAVAVRCSIILGFEHGSAVLGSLRNMLDIQDRLGRRLQSQWRFMIGPKRANAPQNGFGDFAWDFLAEDK